MLGFGFQLSDFRLTPLVGVMLRSYWWTGGTFYTER